VSECRPRTFAGMAPRLRIDRSSRIDPVRLLQVMPSLRGPFGPLPLRCRQEPTPTRGPMASENAENTTKLAGLIDADNAPPSITEERLAESAKYATAPVKAATGAWPGTSLRG